MPNYDSAMPKKVPFTVRYVYKGCNASLTYKPSLEILETGVIAQRAPLRPDRRPCRS